LSATPNENNTDGPFSTIQRARDAIRQLKAKSGGRLPHPVSVQIREGRYYLADPLSLGTGDSGTRDAPIRYMAYAGEHPVLSGGLPLEGWAPWRDQILKCQVPASRGGGWQFRQLFFVMHGERVGKRMIRARYPILDGKDYRDGPFLQMRGTV